MIKARKFIEKKVEGEYEFIKNHVLQVDINQEILEDVAFEFLGAGDDPEWDWTNYGILTNEDGEIDSIKISKFLEAVENKNNEQTNIDDGEPLIKERYDEVQKLTNLKGYNLDF